MNILETRDRGLLRRAFERDPIAAIYQLGDLESPVFERCRWFVATEGGEVRAVVLLYAAVEVAVALPFGDREALDSIVTDYRTSLPVRFYTKLSGEQLDLFPGWSMVEEEAIAVMGLGEFQPAAPGPELELRRIGPGVSSEQLMEVYRHYPGNFFHPSHLEGGLYVGGYVSGKLAVVAGTHAFARSEGAAVLGNIVTAAEFRGRGYCQAGTGFLIEQLRAEGCRHIGLHVNAENWPAIRCYEKVGFTIHSKLSQQLIQQL
ncbi:MAG: GNAT family N-acetyltransferase [bacterium]|nr:GNAT family N-acetyltransferase [bacterium]